MDDLWKMLSEGVESGVPFVLATVVKTEGSAPRKAGAKMLVRSDGSMVGSVGGGALEHAVVEAAKEILCSRESKLLSYRLQPDLGMACGGTADVFIESVLPAQRLYIFGAGHIGQALCPIAASLGYAVTVIDNRTELACRERFPQAVALVHSFDPVCWKDLVFNDQTFCVVATPSHKLDTEVVRALMERPFRYLGMIGSKSKRTNIEKTLAEGGVTPQRMADLHTPLGLPIGAETPAEIAISIAAQLVMVRHSSDR